MIMMILKKINPSLILLVLGFIFLFWHSYLSAANEDFFFHSLSNQYDKVKVARVISADTFELETAEKVRLIGLKGLPAPPRPEKERDEFGFVIKEELPFTTIEEAALNFTRALLEGKQVRLEFDKRKKDESFHTLAYVYLYDSNLFVNAEILKNGFADLQIRPPNMKHSKTLRAAYIEARREKRGLHSSY